MAKHPPSRFPAWTDTLGDMIGQGCRVRVCCDRCDRWSDVDLPALAARVGADYSLVDRRCHCRLTPHCSGWNRFYYLLGVYRPLWSITRSHRWTLC